MYFKQNNTWQQIEMQKQVKNRTVFKSDLKIFKSINDNLLAKIFIVIFHTKYYFC